MRHDVLLALLRAALGSPPASAPTSVLGDLSDSEWEAILLSARRHRLGALLHRGVGRSRATGIPRPVQSALAASYYGSLARNLVLFRGAEALFAAARERGLRLLLLKGGAFAHWLYADPALRPMVDLDVLCRAEERDAVVALAGEVGYEPKEAADHALLLQHRMDGGYLEIHTALTSCAGYLGIVAGELFAAAVSIPFGSGSAETLAPEDHLIHLALHASFQHGLRQAAVNACDVLLLARQGIDPERFGRRARSARLASWVYGGLGLSQRLLPAPELEGVLRDLSALVPPRQKRWVGTLEPARLLSPEPGAVCGPPWKRFSWMAGWRERLALARETLRQHPETETRDVFSPIRRGIALAWRHGLRPWGRPLTRNRTGSGARACVSIGAQADV